MRRYPRDAAEGAAPGEAGQERGRVAAGGRQLRARVGRAGGLQAGAAVRVGGVHEGQPRAPGGPADGGRCGRQGRVRRSAAAEAGGRAEEAAGGDAAEEAGAAVRRDAGEGAEGGEWRDGVGAVRGVRSTGQCGEGTAGGDSKVQIRRGRVSWQSHERLGLVVQPGGGEVGLRVLPPVREERLLSG